MGALDIDQRGCVIFYGGILTPDAMDLFESLIEEFGGKDEPVLLTSISDELVETAGGHVRVFI